MRSRCQALAEEMQRDARVVMFGEGVATKRHDLAERFGAQRVRNTPLAEGIIAGTAAGAAATGLRPVVDLFFAPFLSFAMEEIVNSAGKLRYISGGQFSFPLGGYGDDGRRVGSRSAAQSQCRVLVCARPRAEGGHALDCCGFSRGCSEAATRLVASARALRPNCNRRWLASPETPLSHSEGRRNRRVRSLFRCAGTCAI
jgi:hypothetical protein